MLNGDFSAGNGLENYTFLAGPAGRTLSLLGQGLNNIGFLTIAGTLSINGFSGDSTNSGSMTLSSAFLFLFTLTTLQNHGTLNLNSGLVYGGGGAINNNGTLLGPGIIQIAFANGPAGSVQPNGGTISFSSAWVNAGVVQLAGAASAIQRSAITNTGTIQGAGILFASISNTTGTIDPGGVIDIAGALTNAAGGTLRASVGNKS